MTRIPRGVYDVPDVERLLGWMFHGGEYMEEYSPPPGMPTARGNPAHKCTSWAELVDIRRAWWRAYPRLASPEALWLRYHQGWTEREIGRLYDTGPQWDTVAGDLILLRNTMNRKEVLWPS